MNKIIEYSKKKVPVNAKENAGELLIKCNLEKMKKWSYVQILEIFDSQGNLKEHLKQIKCQRKSSQSCKMARKSNCVSCEIAIFSQFHNFSQSIYNPKSSTGNDPGSRVELIRKTEKLVLASLKLIFEDEQLGNSQFEIPDELELKNMTEELMSEENIRYKFQKVFVEYDRVRHYCIRDP